MILNGLLLIIFALCLSFLLSGGLWGNALALINVTVAALIATNYFEPVADWLEDSVYKGMTYAWDFLAVWLLFAIVYSILRTATDFASRVKVKFRKPVETIGGIFFAAAVGLVVICFTTMTLHTAPLARNFLSGNFKPGDRMFFGIAPDRQWLGFVQTVSSGLYASSKFDPGNTFIAKYERRRADFEKQPGLLK